MSPLPEHPHAAPRWTTLALLGTAVLGVHLTLLVGDLSSLPAPLAPSAPIASSASTAGTAEPRSTDIGTAAPPPAPPRATLSTVRWIVAATPVPAPTPQPVARVEPPPPSPPVARPKPTPRPLPAETEGGAAPNTDGAAPAAGDAVGDAVIGAVAVAPLPATAQPEETTPTETPEATPNTEVVGSAAPVPADTNNPPPYPAQPAHSEPRPPAQPPASTHLVYGVTGTVKGLNYSASGTLDWTHADGRYSARMEMRVLLLGSRVQTSTGRADGSGLLPERFSDKSRSERAAHFDHAQQTIRFSNNRPDAPLQPGAQDRLSLFMQLAGLLQAQPAAYPAGQTIYLQVAGTSDADIWRFRVAEEETLALPAGNLRTRHLVREPREPRDSLIDIWFATDLAHLPVRIRITQDNGDRVDQQLSRMP